MDRTNVDDISQHAAPREMPSPRSAPSPSKASSSPADPQTEAPRRIQMDRLLDAGKNIGAQIDEQVHKRPYVVLGAAAGIGVVAGSLFGTRLGQALLAAGIGYMAKNVLGDDLGLDRMKAGIEKLTGDEDALRHADRPAR